MEITVRKATEADIAKLTGNPTWGCEISEFDWHYSQKEICWLTEGEVTVTYDDGSASFGAGDYCELNFTPQILIPSVKFARLQEFRKFRYTGN